MKRLILLAACLFFVGCSSGLSEVQEEPQLEETPQEEPIINDTTKYKKYYECSESVSLIQKEDAVFEVNPFHEYPFWWDKLIGFSVSSNPGFEEYTQKAINFWNDALGIELFEMSEDSFINIEYQDKYFVSQNGYVSFAFSSLENNICTIYLYKNDNINMIPIVIAHEIGHCLGFSHDLTTNESIMAHGGCVPQYLVDMIYERYEL